MSQFDSSFRLNFIQIYILNMRFFIENLTWGSKCKHFVSQNKLSPFFINYNDKFRFMWFWYSMEEIMADWLQYNLNFISIYVDRYSYQYGLYKWVLFSHNRYVWGISFLFHSQIAIIEQETKYVCIIHNYLFVHFSASTFIVPYLNQFSALVHISIII